MMNMEFIPMLDCPALEDTWVENILSGINYTVFWDLDRLDQDDTKITFFRFLSATNRIMDKVMRREAEGEPKRRVSTLGCLGRDDAKVVHTGIDVFAYETPFAVKSTSRERFELYRNEVLDTAERVLRDDSDSEAPRLRFHRPFSIDNDDRQIRGKWLLRSGFWNAGMVVYVPLPQHRRLEPRGVLQVSEACPSFVDTGGQDGHLLLSVEAAYDVIGCIERFAADFVGRKHAYGGAGWLTPGQGFEDSLGDLAPFKVDGKWGMRHSALGDANVLPLASASSE